MGLRGKPTYRVVVIDSRKARDGRYIESVGSYDPRTKLLNMKPERVQHWVGQGAQPSDTVSALIKRYGKQHPAVTAEVTAEAPAMSEPLPVTESPVVPEPEPVAEAASEPEASN